MPASSPDSRRCGCASARTSAARSAPRWRRWDCPVRSPKVQPEVVLYDPELVATLPAKLTVTSGLNAMAHAVEALYARDANPLSSQLALGGIRAFKNGLPKPISTGRPISWSNSPNGIRVPSSVRASARCCSAHGKERAPNRSADILSVCARPADVAAHRKGRPLVRRHEKKFKEHRRRQHGRLFHGPRRPASEGSVPSDLAPLQNLFVIGALPALVAAAAMWGLMRRAEARATPATEPAT